MTTRRRPGAARPPRSTRGLDALVRWLPAAAVVVSLAYTGQQVLGPGETVAWAAVAGSCVLGVLAVGSARPARPWLFALGGGVGVAFTSREYFSIWPAAAALLFVSVMSSGTARRRQLHPAVVAAVAGLAAAATRDLTPALLPVAVAVLAIWAVEPVLALRSRAVGLEVEADNLRERAQESDEQAREYERRTALARELHDAIGHHVTAMVVQAEAGRVGSPDAALVNIGAMGREALDELEAVLFDLRDPASAARSIDLGSIDTRLARPLREQGIRVEVSLGTVTSDPEVLKALHRAVQEALTNVMRHADASEVTVRVRDDRAHVVARVSDDGIGVPVDLRRGYGLTGIEERVGRLGGTCRVGRGPRGGTEVEVRLPRRRP